MVNAPHDPQVPYAVIPTAFHVSVATRAGAGSDTTIGAKEVLAISRGTPFILLFVYASYREPIVNSVWHNSDGPD